MSQNTSSVSYHLFCENDYEPLARIIGDMWFASYNEHDRLILGMAELDVHLAHTTRALIAKHNGQTIGAGFCRWQKTSNTQKRLAHKDQLIAQYPEIDITSEMGLLLEEDALIARGEKTSDTIGFLELLIVSPSAQGLGAGGELLKSNLTWLKEQGATHYRLVTDDSCDWEFYEHKGLTRTDQMVSRCVQNGEKPFNLYVYEGKL